MVLDRIVEIGGQLALKEFKESVGHVTPPDSSQPSRTLARTPPPARKPVELVRTPPPQEEMKCDHVEQEIPTEIPEKDEEVPGPSDEFYESMSKMEMAHEIVMNDKYQIQRNQPEG